MSDFIPTSDDALNLWLANFKTKLTGYADTLSIAASDITNYQDQCDALTAAIVEVNTFHQQYRNKVKSKDDLRTLTIGGLRTLINRIKTEPAYTQAMGADLGIIGTAQHTDFSAAKPALTAGMVGGQITVAFKRGHSNGIRLYCKRGSETTFSFLALDTHSPYHDTRENLVSGTPETRQYYAYYINNTDEQVGLQSDVVSVMV